MAFRACVGSPSHDATLAAITLAVKENAEDRLRTLLQNGKVTPEALDKRHLVHTASWLGFDRCVRILIEAGADPDLPHRGNGCTPLHLAHFCQVEDTDPGATVSVLTSSGASINHAGSGKCGHLPLVHAIQHQRVDAARVFIKAGSSIALQSVFAAIDVARPDIVELLLTSGGKCGSHLEAEYYWGAPLRRVLHSPMKSPRESYKQMVRLLCQATVCKPVRPTKQSSVKCLGVVQSELKTLTRNHMDILPYLLACLTRNGYYPSESLQELLGTLNSWHHVTWLQDYLAQPSPLQDLCVRVLRSNVYCSGNVIYGASQLPVPQKVKDAIVMINPL